MTVALDGVRLAGTRPANALEAVVFAATAPDVHNVIVDGREIVTEGRHVSIDVPRELDDEQRQAVEQLADALNGRNPRESLLNEARSGSGEKVSQ